MNTRWPTSLVVLLVALLHAAPAGAQQLEVPLDDYGPVLVAPQQPVARAAELPPAAEGVGDVIVQAGGGLVLMVPPGWHVTEIPWVREERLAITPEPLAGARRMPTDGAWLTYHYRPAGQPEPPLAEIIGPRLALATSSQSQTPGPPVDEEINGWPACRQPFRIESEGQTSLGQHLLVRTPWGIVELHLRYPESQAEAREALLRPMVRQLKLAAPEQPAGPIEPAIADAGEALGAWKAYAARMEFRRDGRVIMYFDNRRIQPIDQAPVARTRITGSFTAEDDVIRVTWDDGSQQNFRWERSNLDLVLTDHTGQVSALRRLFQ